MDYQDKPTDGFAKPNLRKRNASPNQMAAPHGGKSKFLFLANSSSGLSRGKLKERANKYIHKNSFFNFLVDYRQQVVNADQKEIARGAGKMWRSMSEEQKRPYLEAADANSAAAGTKQREAKRAKNDSYEDKD